MAEKVSSDELASLAGRILAAGNPLENEQVARAAQNVLDPAHRDFVWRQLKALFTPYFENMLALAGSVLSQARDDDDEDEDAGGEVRLLAKTITDPEGAAAFSEFFNSAMVTYGTEEFVAEEVARRLDSMSAREAVLSLLKGLYPGSTDWGRLALATGHSNMKDLARELKESDEVRQDDAAVFATRKTMADRTIEALPWPSAPERKST